MPKHTGKFTKKKKKKTKKKMKKNNPFKGSK